MIRARTSQQRCLRRLILLMSVMTLLSCKPHRSYVEVELEAGREFTVTVNNRSDDLLIVDDRLLGLGIDSPVKLEVADQSGAIIPPCGHLDYVAPRELLSVVPGGTGIVSIPVSAVTLTHCLHDDGRYMLRAVLVSGGEVISGADWVSFRAISPLENTNE